MGKTWKLIKAGAKKIIPICFSPFNSTRSPRQAIRQEEEKEHQIGKRSKLSLFSGDIILYLEKK